MGIIYLIPLTGFPSEFWGCYNVDTKEIYRVIVSNGKKKHGMFFIMIILHFV